LSLKSLVKFSNKTSYVNRGLDLESDINITNKFYLDTNKAVIYKKPTPISVIKVDYKSKKSGLIKEAYFETPSTTDYNGIYKGKYIDFEAKETRSKTSFSLSNIHSHQIKHMEIVKSHGALTFLIIRFTTLRETYFFSIRDLMDFIKSSKLKSIPIDVIREKGILIKDRFNPRVDYLEVVDSFYFGGKK